MALPTLWMGVLAYPAPETLLQWLQGATMGQREGLVRPLRPCPVPSCPELVRSGRCAAHTQTREQRNPKDPAQATFYGSVVWQGTRKGIRMRDPICKVCHRKPTKSVDHIDGDWRNNDPTNLQGICKDCHSFKSGREHSAKRSR